MALLLPAEGSTLKGYVAFHPFEQFPWATPTASLHEGRFQSTKWRYDHGLWRTGPVLDKVIGGNWKGTIIDAVAGAAVSALVKGGNEIAGERSMAHIMMDPVDPIILDRLTQLAAQVLDVAVVCVSLVDEHRRTVVSSHGLGTPADAPLAPYMGMRLVASNGRAVGTLTVMDRKPCRWDASQIDFLRELTVRLVAQVDIGPVERMMWREAGWTLSAARYERFTSRGEGGFADNLPSAMRRGFGGHAEKASQ